MKTPLRLCVAAAFRRMAVIGDSKIRSGGRQFGRINQQTTAAKKEKKGKAGQQRDRRITSRKSAWPLRMKSWLPSAARGYKVVKIEIVRANDGP